MHPNGKIVNGNAKTPDRPPFAAYQLRLYDQGLRQGIMPPTTTDPNKLRDEASTFMMPMAYNYIAGGAGEGATMDANRLAFRQWKIVPRMLAPTLPRDLSVKLFGYKYRE